MSFDCNSVNFARFWLIGFFGVFCGTGIFSSTSRRLYVCVTIWCIQIVGQFKCLKNFRASDMIKYKLNVYQCFVLLQRFSLKENLFLYRFDVVDNILILNIFISLEHGLWKINTSYIPPTSEENCKHNRKINTISFDFTMLQTFKHHNGRWNTVTRNI